MENMNPYKKNTIYQSGRGVFLYDTDKRFREQSRGKKCSRFARDLVHIIHAAVCLRGALCLVGTCMITVTRS